MGCNMNKIKAMDYSIIDLANKIIEQTKIRNIILTKAKLYTLLYYVYGEYLTQENIRLIKDDEPSKWNYSYGFPIFFKLHSKIRNMNRIDKINCETLDSLENIEITKDKKLDNTKLDEIIDEVFRKYGQKTTVKLIKDVCISGYAWDKTSHFTATILDKYIIEEFNDRKKNIIEEFSDRKKNRIEEFSYKENYNRIKETIKKLERLDLLDKMVLKISYILSSYTNLSPAKIYEDEIFDGCPAMSIQGLDFSGAKFNLKEIVISTCYYDYWKYNNVRYHIKKVNSISLSCFKNMHASEIYHIITNKDLIKKVRREIRIETKIKKFRENPFVVMFLIPFFIFFIWILILNYLETTYKNNDNNNNIKTESKIKPI